MVDVTVVGDGILGRTIATALRAAGHDVDHLAERPGPETASFAALCVIGAGWASGRGAAAATHWRALGAVSAQTGNGLTLVDPELALSGPPARPGTWPDDADPDTPTVLCRGSETPDDGRRLWGATSVWPDTRTPEIRSRAVNPRQTEYAIANGRDGRYGSSRSIDRRRAIAAQIDAHDRHRAALDLPPAADARLLVGARLMPADPRVPAPVQQIAARRWTVEGAGRLGYTIAPARAAEIVRILRCV